MWPPAKFIRSENLPFSGNKLIAIARETNSFFVAFNLSDNFRFLTNKFFLALLKILVNSKE